MKTEKIKSYQEEIMKVVFSVGSDIEKADKITSIIEDVYEEGKKYQIELLKKSMSNIAKSFGLPDIL